MMHYCTYCGSKLHNENLCPKTVGGSVARTHLRCTYCGGRDHDKEVCPKTHGGNLARKNYPNRAANHFVLDKIRRGF